MNKPFFATSAMLCAALLVVCASVALAGPPIPRALHCEMLIDAEDGTFLGPFDLWAEGNRTHVILRAPGNVVHTLQLDDSLYTWDESGHPGSKRGLGTGMASYGVVRQIERLRDIGRLDKEWKDADGAYAVYVYSAAATDAQGLPYLEDIAASFDVRSGAPQVWMSRITYSGRPTQSMTMLFRNVIVNPRMPIDIFELPHKVEFAEVP